MKNIVIDTESILASILLKTNKISNNRIEISQLKK